MADPDIIGAPIEYIGVNRQAHAGCVQEVQRLAKLVVPAYARDASAGRLATVLPIDLSAGALRRRKSVSQDADGRVA
jgi:hypothetical protein